MDINDQIAENAGLIYKQLSSFNLLYDQDAESFAYEALYKAILTYDKDTGTAFSTYATCCIANALRKHLRTLNKKRQLDVVSYYELISTKENSDELIDIIPQLDTTTDAEAVYLFKELQGVVSDAFVKVLRGMSEKHQTVITRWYNSDCKMTQCELAKALQISQPTVSKAISVFKYRLKLELEEYM